MLPRLVRVRAALDCVADALVLADLAALLGAEAELHAAVAECSPSDGLTREQRSEVRGEIERLRGAVARCRRLGANLTDVVGSSLDAQGRAAAGDQRAWTGLAIRARA